MMIWHSGVHSINDDLRTHRLSLPHNKLKAPMQRGRVTGHRVNSAYYSVFCCLPVIEKHGRNIKNDLRYQNFMPHFADGFNNE